MNYDSSGTVFPVGYGIDDDEIMKAVIEEGESSGKSCWTSTNDEDGGSIGKRHVVSVQYRGV